MDLGWPHRRCILCLREPSPVVPFSRAHIVPESIGGFVWAWTTCKEHNEQTGSRIEAGIVKDDSILFAVRALAGELPELARRFAERETLIAHTPHGLLRARLREGEIEILTTSNDEGSLTQSRESARQTLEVRLRRGNHPPAEVAAALQIFDEGVAGVPVQIGEHVVTHGQVENFQPALAGEPVSEAFPSLLAFHVLALALGPSAYDERLNPLREAILAGEPRSDWHIAERFVERAYRPEHLVGVAQSEPYVVMRVQLFGWSVWRVHFPRIASKSEPHGMLLDLRKRELHLATPRTLAGPLPPPGSGA